jgi:hypothetical protein
MEKEMYRINEKRIGMVSKFFNPTIRSRGKILNAVKMNKTIPMTIKDAKAYNILFMNMIQVNGIFRIIEWSLMVSMIPNKSPKKTDASTISM